MGVFLSLSHPLLIGDSGGPLLPSTCEVPPDPHTTSLPLPYSRPLPLPPSQSPSPHLLLSCQGLAACWVEAPSSCVPQAFPPIVIMSLEYRAEVVPHGEGGVNGSDQQTGWCL